MANIEHDEAAAEALEEAERHYATLREDRNRLQILADARGDRAEALSSQLRRAVEAIKALREHVRPDDPDEREAAYARGYLAAVTDALESLARGR